METTTAIPGSSTVASSAVAPPSVRSTKHHWRVLRNALVSRTRDESEDTTASSVSTGFFPIYQPAAASPHEFIHQAAAPDSEWHAYTITSGSNPLSSTVSKRVLVHEKKKRQKVTIAELLSHKLNHGVDNTGNIRTWPSEQVLLSYLLKNQVCEALSKQFNGNRIRCIELGAGMAGLAGLGLMAHHSDVIEEMVITDGNPQSVENLHACVGINIAHGIILGRTTQELLRWDRSTQFPSSRQFQFDLIFASDCLFFEEFHQDLAHTIKQLLKPASGVCYLLQPSRNGSMERFCNVATKEFDLDVDTCRDFDPAITEKHDAYVATRQADYVPDVHLPILVRIRSL